MIDTSLRDKHHYHLTLKKEVRVLEGENVVYPKVMHLDKIQVRHQIV